MPDLCKRAYPQISPSTQIVRTENSENEECKIAGGKAAMAFFANFTKL
ncbi:MAG: hypothetical protein GQF41_1392 [Candidatus Rifleibacterium amylolyticum]|nr:MAG: hypothetical protein GQF41_1392 [Candidatus Rifleibacterium amylolyticum]